MNDFYFKYRNSLAPEKGCILISEPYLPDPNFQRTVVQLCEHNADGTFGFVMNKESNVKLKDLMDVEMDENPDVYIGGPVQKDTLHFLHTSTSFHDGVEIAKGLYWGGNFEKLVSMIQMDEVKIADFRFFVGYSGWGEGQLVGEIDENSWIVAEGLTGAKLLQTHPDELWKELLESMGGKYSMFSKYPEDPRLN